VVETAQVHHAVRRAATSPWADRVARLGFCARGVVYAIIGLLAAQIALGGSQGKQASKDGALREIAERRFGGLLLAVLAVGLAGYIVWRLSEAIWGKQDEDDDAKRHAKRLGSAAKAAVYGAFLASTVRFITSGPGGGGGSGGDRQEQTLTARVLGWPAGRWLVGAIGVAVIAGGAYTLYRGVAQKFEKKLDTTEMDPPLGPAVSVLGTVGMAARGFVFGLAGYLVVRAALDYNPQEAVGLDGTLKTLAQQPFGEVLLLMAAVGLVAYGLYSFAEARYRQL
jgi:hypothetical protein